MGEFLRRFAFQTVFQIIPACNTRAGNRLISRIYYTFDFVFFIQRLQCAPGVVLQNDESKNEYPLATEATGHDEVYIGRIRRDESVESGVNLWVVADKITGTRPAATSFA
mgnify:CR=1 FL=1